MSRLCPVWIRIGVIRRLFFPKDQNDPAYHPRPVKPAALTSLPSSTVMREKNMTQVLGVTTEKEKRVVEKRADEVSSEAAAGAEQKRTN